jgi:hypothetical protein
MDAAAFDRCNPAAYVGYTFMPVCTGDVASGSFTANKVALVTRV